MLLLIVLSLLLALAGVALWASRFTGSLVITDSEGRPIDLHAQRP